MPAVEYTWEFVYDLWGDRVPVMATLEATASLYTKVGTLLVMDGGQVDDAVADAAEIIGIAAEAISVAATAADPIKVYIIAPGMVIRGTADEDATALAGFSGKTIDLHTDGRLDVGDTDNGCLSVYRVLPGTSGLTVDCVVTTGAMLEA